MIKLKTNYKYQVVYSLKFKKSLRKIIKHGKDINKLEQVVEKLANKEKLALKYKNHKLINDRTYQNCSECHIEPDWLLVYQYNDNKLLLLLMNNGSHSELFDK